MNRRDLFAAFGALPFLGWLKPKSHATPTRPVVWKSLRLKHCNKDGPYWSVKPDIQASSIGAFQCRVYRSELQTQLNQLKQDWFAATVSVDETRISLSYHWATMDQAKQWCIDQVKMLEASI